MAGVILVLCVINFLFYQWKNGQNRCTFTEVIAKLNQGYRFLDHSVDVRAWGRGSAAPWVMQYNSRQLLRSTMHIVKMIVVRNGVLDYGGVGGAAAPRPSGYVHKVPPLTSVRGCPWGGMYSVPLQSASSHVQSFRAGYSYHSNTVLVLYQETHCATWQL